jgi:hypothetical protein
MLTLPHFLRAGPHQDPGGIEVSSSLGYRKSISGCIQFMLSSCSAVYSTSARS